MLLRFAFLLTTSLAVSTLVQCAIQNDYEDLTVSNCGLSKAFPNHRRPRKGLFRSKRALNHLSKRSIFTLFQDTFRSRSKPKARIIEGDMASKGAWPWQVSIQLSLGLVGNVGHWCGGVLVHPKWIVTAGHCMNNPIIQTLGGGTWSVILSDHNRDFLGNDGEIVLPIEEYIVHPNFEVYQNDIAMLRLPSDPRISRLSPACLPVNTQHIMPNVIDQESKTDPFLGVKCIATGWGQDNVHKSDLQADLHQVELTIVNSSICRSMYKSRYSIPIKDHHICAGPTDPTARKGTCVGDSGGPIHCNLYDGRWYLAGITSFGSGCAKPGYPDVFTRITSYFQWMREVMENHEMKEERMKQRENKLTLENLVEWISWASKQNA